MSNEVEALKLTSKMQFFGDLTEVNATLLHQVRVSNNDPQILAQWAMKMLNNITLFNAEVRDGLDPQWLEEAGLGPAYAKRAHGQKGEATPSKLGCWKRAANLSEPRAPDKRK